MKLTFKIKIILLFSIVILGIIVSVLITERNESGMQKSNELVEHTHQVFAKSSHIESIIQYNLIANQSYRISGYTVFLEETQLAYKEINKQLAELGLLVKDNKKQVLRIKYLENLVDMRIIFLYKDNQRAVGKGFDLKYNLDFLNKKKVYLDQVKRTITGLQDEENKLLKIHQDEYFKSNVAFYNSFYLLLFFVLGLIILMFFLLKYNLKEKEKIKDILLAKNEWHNQLMGSLGWGVISVDVNGVITFINLVAQELSGWKEEKWIGQVIDDIFEIRNEEGESKVTNTLVDVMQEDKVLWLGGHTVLKREDGSKIDIDGSGAPIHNQDRRIIGSVLLFRDISEEKKVQVELQTSLKEINDYRHALDESSIVAITNQKGVISYVNDNFCKISKFSRDELIGQDHRVINSGHHSKEFFRELWTAIANGKIWKGEIKNRSKDATLYWVDTTIVPFLNEEGKPYQYVSIRSDITERKKLEEEFLTLANNMAQQAWMANKDGVYWYNQRWLEYCGGTLDEMKGYGWHKVHHPDHLQRFLAKRKQGMESGEGWEDVHPLRGSDGSYRWFLSRVVPTRDTQGKVIRWFGTNTDTTILKEAEEKLVEKQRELELKVEELYKTNSELDRFVYRTSHDLRAPLKSMLGLIGIVKEREESSNVDQLKRLEMLNKSIVKLDAFIEDILNYSRNTRVDVVKEEINFEEIIQEIRKSHEFMEGADEIKFEVEIHQTENFLSDKRRINVLLKNLISNAIKYKDGNKEASFVTILIECDSENGIITIEDNGIGISEEHQEKVFEMFYRATKLSTGSGLGMYIAKETLEKLGGSITLKSELNIGTKFIIQIPNQQLDYLQA
jgi:PAS domain S-box-containing protein